MALSLFTANSYNISKINISIFVTFLYIGATPILTFSERFFTNISNWDLNYMQGFVSFYCQNNFIPKYPGCITIPGKNDQ